MRKLLDWPLEDLPREKFLKFGAEALSDAELLAILVGSGTKEMPVVPLMQQILTDYHSSLNELGRATIAELKQYKGMGDVKSITVLAACQLAQRRLKEERRAVEKITCSRDIYTYFLDSMVELAHEECHVMLLRHNFSVIRTVRLSSGGLTDTLVDVRMLIKQAILADATTIALCHNHPSGSLAPSKADDDLTRSVKEACSYMKIRMLDHIILTSNGYYSYADEGRL